MREVKQVPLVDISSKFHALQASYYKLLEENKSLRSNKMLEKEASKSTVQFPDKDFEQFRVSIAYEIEESHEILSCLHESIKYLLIELSQFQHEKEEYERKISHLKYNLQLQKETNKTKIALIQETIQKKTFELTSMNTEKRKIEKVLLSAEQDKLNLQQDIRNTGTRIKFRETNSSSETAAIAELYGKLVLANEMISVTDDKLNQWEKYMQKNKR